MLPSATSAWQEVTSKHADKKAVNSSQYSVQSPAYAWVLVDSTTVKAHKAAAGQKKQPHC
ncbi:MAG: hypothetical protein ACRYFZ_09025 [Janthinobacterium lividum]